MYSKLIPCSKSGFDGRIRIIKNGAEPNSCDLSLITKTFQATHCFDHIAFPQRL